MSLSEFLSRLKFPQRPMVVFKGGDDFSVSELTGTRYYQPIEMSNTLRQTADVLVNNPNSALHPRYAMQEILLMGKMYKVFKDLPEGDFTEQDGKIQLTRENDGITVTYEDPDKDQHENPKRKMKVRWFKSEPTTERFTHCHVLDQLVVDGKLDRTVETRYEEFGNIIGRVRGYVYNMKMSESLESSSVEKRIRYHKGRYSHDGTPLLVSQSWLLCPALYNVNTGSFPSSTLNST